MDVSVGVELREAREELQRAHETCQLALASMAGPCQDTWSTERIRRDVRLNERHYGALQGYRKCDPTLLSRFGDDELCPCLDQLWWSC